MTHGGNPFPGLRPFEAGESHLFFGREGQSAELLRLLREQHVVVVVGTSGSGKSSLARAGLLPSLHAGFMSGAGSEWRVALLRPGGDPFSNLARALAAPGVLRDDVADAGLEAALNDATLRLGALGLVERVAEARLPPGQNLLVVVDQFEEIFRLERGTGRDRFREDAAAFVKLLLEAASQRDVPIFVLLTMRSDFLGDCARFRDLPEAINRGQYLIPRLTRDQRRLAITGPVRVGGAEIADRLVSRLLNDAGDDPDQLPILQHALMRTWDCWAQRGGPGTALDLEHYEQVGGWRETLKRHAEEAFAELDPDGRDVAERVFRRLTEKGSDNREIRRPTVLAELCAVAGAAAQDVTAVVDVFRKPGRSFLTPAAGTPLTSETWIDISHESLIRNWDRLRQWVDAEADSARVYRRLAQTAALYAKERAALWQDPDLALALEWWQRDRPNEAWARAYDPGFAAARGFLKTSRRARDAVRWRRRRARAAVGLGLAAGLVLFAWLWRRAEGQRAVAELAHQQALTAEHRAQLEALQGRVSTLGSNNKIIALAGQVLEPPNDAERARAHFERAMAFGQTQQHDSAIAEYKRHLSVFPEDLVARNNLCHRYMIARNLALAKAECARVVQRAPRWFLGHLNTGMVASFERRYEDAAASFAQAIDATRYNFGSIFDDDVSPIIQRVTGRRILTIDGPEIRTTLMYGLASIMAYAGSDSFPSAFDQADRQRASYDAVLYALNWTRQHFRETGNPAALAAEGALWERLGIDEEAARAYREFQSAEQASSDPRYAGLVQWVGARVRVGAPAARLTFGRLDDRRLALEADEFWVAGKLDSALTRIDSALSLTDDSLGLLITRMYLWNDSINRNRDAVRADSALLVNLRRDVDRILARVPTFAVALYYRGWLHTWKTASRDSAIADLRRALDFDSTHGNAAWNLYELTRGKNPASDLRLLRLVQRAFPTSQFIADAIAATRKQLATESKSP